MGKKVSRKDIFNHDESSEEDEDDDEDGSEDDEDNDDGVSERSAEENSNSGSDVEGDDASASAAEEKSGDESDDDVNSSQEDDEEGSDFDGDFGNMDLSNPLRRVPRSETNIKTMSATNVRAEIEKGNCVREQLKLWENLLEMRIKLQKCLINSNRMPQHDAYKTYESNDEFKSNCKNVKSKLGGLLNNLLQLQGNLLNNFPETKGIVAKGQKRKSEDKGELETGNDSMDEEIPSDTEDEMNDGEQTEDEQGESEVSDGGEKKEPVRKKIKLSDFESTIAKNHKAYTEYRNSVIQKWNDKTRIASGVISKGINQPAVKQIEFALANKDKLVKKTQLKRSEYDIVGKFSSSLKDSDGRRTQEYDSEIYDDDDFYHQLLRELIEYKSADITDPIQLSKQWIQLQNMRSKMKRKIDTRATKGRRIRYNVHQKLVNFMAPITVFDTWTDHAKNELYSSLFGRIKPVSEETKPT